MLELCKERKPKQGKPIKGKIKVLLSEYAMHSYGIRLYVIEIKISNIQLNASLNKINLSIASL